MYTVYDLPIPGADFGRKIGKTLKTVGCNRRLTNFKA